MLCRDKHNVMHSRMGSDGDVDVLLHQRLRIDVAIQGDHGVNYKSYWVDERAGKIFCLVEAPSAEAAHTVHREAHGLVADDIYEVTEGR